MVRSSYNLERVAFAGESVLGRDYRFFIKFIRKEEKMRNLVIFGYYKSLRRFRMEGYVFSFFCDSKVGGFRVYYRGFYSRFF